MKTIFNHIKNLFKLIKSLIVANVILSCIISKQALLWTLSAILPLGLVYTVYEVQTTINEKEIEIVNLRDSIRVNDSINLVEFKSIELELDSVREHNLNLKQSNEKLAKELKSKPTIRFKEHSYLYTFKDTITVFDIDVLSTNSYDRYSLLFKLKNKYYHCAEIQVSEQAYILTSY
jgi:hypothetical protein